MRVFRFWGESARRSYFFFETAASFFIRARRFSRLALITAFAFLRCFLSWAGVNDEDLFFFGTSFGLFLGSLFLSLLLGCFLLSLLLGYLLLSRLLLRSCLSLFLCHNVYSPN